MQRNDLPYYVAPDVEIISVAIERGFANSFEDPFEKPEFEW